MKKVLALLLALAMILSFAACGETKQEEKTEEQETVVEEEKVLTVAHKGDPQGLCCPITPFGSSNGPVDCVLYDRLLDYDATTGEVLPMLATEWKYIDDKQIEFTLRSDVVAHDGSKFKASDVLYTLKTGLDAGKLNTYYKNFDLDNCKVVDDTHVIIAFKDADPFALNNLSNIPLSMIVEEAVTNKGTLDDQQLAPTAGTGPYKMVSWEQGTQIIFERNENYWGEKPYYDKVVFKIIKEASTRVMALESGDVDICLDPATSQISLVDGKEGFTVLSFPTTNQTNFFMNNAKAPFDDDNFRKAVALAINYEANLKIGAAGYGTISDSYLPVSSPAYYGADGSYENYYHYDVEAAKEMIAKSKYADGATINLLIMEGAAFSTFATLLQEQLAVIGVTVNIQPTASATLNPLLHSGDFECVIMNCSNPDPKVQTYYYDGRVDYDDCGGGTAWQGSDELNELMDKAYVEIDDTTRNNLYKQIQNEVNANVPGVPLYSPNKLCLTKSNVQGIKLTVFSDIDVSKAYAE